ncbi:hypothetical protein HX049_17105 [Myroides odoratimimus]|uniref:hypothetical protein n=1 Tax=Myroides odoratimimus TaxID=76832 RepID=UPI0025761616|nr:hypothetical protein [Myroides odoratimimus]MDM1398863.1 hypothetical protein [Myroides odoratimimus]
MRKLLLVLFMMFSVTSFAQMATFDATAAANALSVIERSTETVTKLNDLKDATEKTYNLVTKVSTVISTGKEVVNIFQYQSEILSGISSIRKKLGRIPNQQTQKNYSLMLVDLIDETNRLILKVNNVVKTGTLSMNDYERLTILSEIEGNMRSLSTATKRMDRKLNY